MAVEAASDPVRRARSTLANAHKRDANPARIAEARRALTAAKLERAIMEALAADPAITLERRAELVQVLAGDAR